MTGEINQGDDQGDDRGDQPERSTGEINRE